MSIGRLGSSVNRGWQQPPPSRRMTQGMRKGVLKGVLRCSEPPLTPHEQKAVETGFVFRSHLWLTVNPNDLAHNSPLRALAANSRRGLVFSDRKHVLDFQRERSSMPARDEFAGWQAPPGGSQPVGDPCATRAAQAPVLRNNREARAQSRVRMKWPLLPLEPVNGLVSLKLMMGAYQA